MSCESWVGGIAVHHESWPGDSLGSSMLMKSRASVVASEIVGNSMVLVSLAALDQNRREVDGYSCDQDNWSDWGY